VRRTNEKLDGPIVVEQDLCLDGMVVGDATVAPGVRLQLNGTVTGDLTVEDGAAVELNGTLHGHLINYGRCDVHGVIHGPIYDEQRGRTTLHPGAVHDSDVST
jgi:hypothetical protein